MRGGRGRVSGEPRGGQGTPTTAGGGMFFSLFRLLTCSFQDESSDDSDGSDSDSDYLGSDLDPEDGKDINNIDSYGSMYYSVNNIH